MHIYVHIELKQKIAMPFLRKTKYGAFRVMTYFDYFLNHFTFHYFCLYIPI